MKDQLVFYDKSAYNRRTLIRKYGRAPSGLQATVLSFFVWGTQYSVAAALGTNGYVATSIQEGPLCADDVLEFFNQSLLPNMNPFPGHCSVIVMDNAIIHKRQDICDAVEAAGCRMEFLPPYSPDFSLVSLNVLKFHI
ncbi:hypothetical protein M427DRAFT_496407 [Gonapodya prolifera JEL478]|uniref:Tc1-like transposase DDE domain-containing protein n=1 Tax=Gonapodya prolifera (strain JEL478) TaxID=1344416 RepID=A0A139AWE6_GONPJ|nr:hypothetical protein M427DRAFT_496407 [Gonapodya prolifera JEL478]|eukprot:KXS21062.1 hypothetical protein M427DRAFT_496407 [Gonapodya prolifera JEL478]